MWNPWELALGRDASPETKPKMTAKELLHWKRSVRARMAWKKRKAKERARQYALEHHVTMKQYREMCAELAKNKVYGAILREARQIRASQFFLDRAV